ncbi:MAG: hypothetical protein AB1668_01390 [Nanoarchaeota archaeon]
MKKEQLLRKGLLIGVGVAAYAKERAQKAAKELVRRGNISEAEGKKLVKKIYLEAEKSRKRIASVVESEMKRLMNAADRKRAKKKRR